MRSHRIAFALVLAIVLAGPAAAQEAPPAPGEPRDFKLSETTTFDLPNGMKVTLAPYGWIPKATVQLVVRTGNIDESADETWLADLTGDLMMEGTAARTGREIALEAARMGGRVNVGTGLDETTVGGDALAEFAPDLVRLVAEIARRPSFPESEMPRLQADMVRNVMVARSQPQQIALEKFRQVMYGDHPYGRTFPTPEMVQGFTVEQVKAFHAGHFGAARAHLYVAGRFDRAAVEAAVREAFGDWEAGTPFQNTPAQPASERKIHLLDRPGAVQSTVYLGVPVEVDPSHADWVPLQVTNSLLGGSFNSRITSNIREDKGYTYSPFSQVSSRYRDAYWVEVADVTTAVTGASLEEIFKEVDRLQAEPPSGEELRGIQNYMAGIFVLQNSSPGGIVGQLRFVNLHGLDPSYLTGYVSKVYAVTPVEVQRVAATHIDDTDMMMVVAGDVVQIRDQLAPFGTIVEPTSPPLRRE